MRRIPTAATDRAGAVTAEYEYRGMMAAAWDLLRGDTSGWEDRPFYLAAIGASGEPALDVGCGTGRLLLDYRQQGIDIEGVDDSPEMLGICRDKLRGSGSTYACTGSAWSSSTCRAGTGR